MVSAAVPSPSAQLLQTVACPVVDLHDIDVHPQFKHMLYLPVVLETAFHEDFVKLDFDLLYSLLHLAVLGSQLFLHALRPVDILISQSPLNDVHTEGMKVFVELFNFGVKVPEQDFFGSFSNGPTDFLNQPHLPYFVQ